MKHFLLNPECYFVKGAKRGAIYDLDRGKVLSVDPELANILEMSEKGKALNEITEFNENKEDAINLLNKFKEIGIGKFYDSFFIIEKIRPSFTKNQINNIWIQKRITHAFIEITNSCNLNCVFCHQNTYKVNRYTGCKRWPDSKKAVDKLTLDHWKNILSDLQKLKYVDIIFMGGEPLLLKKELIELIKYAKQSGTQNIKIFTNGILLDKNVLRVIQKHNVELIIQIYSHKSTVTDRITRIKNTHNKLINNLNLIRDMNIKFMLNLIQLRKYADQYDDTYSYFEKFNPSKILSNPVYLSKYKPYNGNLDNFEKKFYRKTAHEILSKNFSKERFFRYCEGNSCWDLMLAVTERGNMIPCPMARREIFNNVKVKSIREVFRDREFDEFWDMSRDKIEICKDCEYRYSCADCRPLEKSYAKTRGLNERTQFCTYDPYKGIWGGQIQ